MLDKTFIKEKLKEFLLEDIGYKDLTTDNIENHKSIHATIIAKEDLILAGIDFAVEIFRLLDNDTKILFQAKEGTLIKKGENILTLQADSKAILKGERTALNILQRLSGIATNTKRYVEKIKDTKTKLLDTRKTTPGFRAFEKYAVTVGGGYNHRFALYDMVMIKDNHIKLIGNIEDAVNQIKNRVSPMTKIEIEVSNLDQLKQALKTDVDIIMLDNMSLEEIKKAVKITKQKKPLEVSGNINLDNIRDIALTGVDFISSGSIIHASRWVDISLRL
ncbi:MAG: carboxylating nicotinate-nucleotide diphosphorylase [Aquificae bacterium]|nr:carboxylating nicotinate-nucleotide diphosphorylase [Aquificota bacterium]